ncbi:hypothetical protein [Paenibacillus sp. H1-7]|uniref:hypothetical protein n=1 Tax=Paenibacillus sp. H1-7 TaxID=2282849 RepID=UPI001EF98E7E|nr:hypothetical protein [Paenibacillus sp. H1-7]
MNEVTISRLPDSVIEELEDEVSKLADEHDISPDIIRTLNLLIMGYHVAWDALDGQDLI